MANTAKQPPERVEGLAIVEKYDQYFSKWSVRPVSAGVNFLGYRIWPSHKLLRKDSVRRAKRKIRAYTEARDTEALRFFLAAWLGHAKWADSHNLLRSLARQHRAILEETDVQS